LELFADSAQNRCEKGEQELLVQQPRKTCGVIVLAGTGVSKLFLYYSNCLQHTLLPLENYGKEMNFLGDFHIFLVS
jgi:hypothetical protein